ncbi:MAG: prolyl oligopeptidase family serine peptidase [Bacteroidota bacterium]
MKSTYIIKWPRTKSFFFSLTFLFFFLAGNAKQNEIYQVLEDFRIGIISLEDEDEWSELFLHDTITWAMIREGQTELVKNSENPTFRFYSSNPISFFKFLKSKNQQFEEKFFNIMVSTNDKFATVDFQYTFNQNGKILNWGKEHWSMLKVKGEWKISSVTWTENLQTLEKCPFSNMDSFALSQYRCPPCPFDCQNILYNKPGICNVCGMQLVEVENNVFNRYKESNFYISNGDVKLFAAYYLPKDMSKLKGAVVVTHGSAPTTHEDLSFYTNLATELNMAVLAYDKRGTGQSSGKYENFTVEGSQKWFDLLASDLEACAEWLKGRSELKDLKLGFLGGSQAGWIMPLAASRIEGIDFMVIGEGAAVSAGEEHFFSNLTGDGGPQKSSIEAADLALQSWDGDKGFDPRPILKKLKVHTFWMFGTNDPVVPVDASLRVLRKMNNPFFEIKILQNGDHNFKNTLSGERYDLITCIKPWMIKTKMILD